MEMRVKEVSCDTVCSSGACKFVDCNDDEIVAKCPGGGCHFERCSKPSCEGGNCVFIDCTMAVCDGGACNFIEPKESLRSGYCPGDSCTLDGIPHPNMASGDFLSI